MSELNSAGIRATLGAGALILNDYRLKIEAIEGGHRLTATKGSETQTMDVRDGVDGRSAYQFAVASGYTGTEAEFSEALAEVMEITGAEAARQAAEQARATAEQGRKDAEIQRQSDIAEAVGTANSAASAANSAAELASSAAESANAAAENANGIVENLCTPFEVTGGIVTCSPVEGQPLGVVSRIDAVQAGEGDPSPENVRPIQGWDSVTLSHTNDGGTEKTYTAALPETVYGGTLDWATGVLMVNRAIFTATSTNTFDLLGDTVRCSVTLSKKAVTAKSGSAISNYLKERVNYAADEESFYTNQTQLLIKIKASRLSSSDNAGINAFLAENPLTVVYKLDTPYTIQLTPQQIAALPGLNTLYSSTGDTIVSGPVSPPSQTAEIMERIAALEDADSGGGVKTGNGVAPDNAGNVKIDVGVKTVNGVSPDASGNVEVENARTLVFIQPNEGNPICNKTWEQAWALIESGKVQNLLYNSIIGSMEESLSCGVSFAMLDKIQAFLGNGKRYIQFQHGVSFKWFEDDTWTIG